MKPLIIGYVLKALLHSYENGDCDNLSSEQLEEALKSLSSLLDILANKQDVTMTIEEASRFLNVTRQTIYNYTKQGRLHPKKRLGGTMEYMKSELQTLIINS